MIVALIFGASVNGPLTIPIVKGSNIVSEESAYILVENDYYIANISKSYGLIRNFYIKPQDSVDIIAHYNNIWGLGFHEIEAYDGESLASGWQTTSQNEHYDTTVMYNDGSTVVVRSRFRLHDLTPPPDLQFNITEWKVFYANKPWFLVTLTRENLVAQPYLHEDQICFIYNDNWVSHRRLLDDNGDVNYDGTGVINFGYHFATKHIQKYLWVYSYNSTYDLGIGHILVDVYPRSLLTSIGYWMDAGEYDEWQITLNRMSHGFPAEEKDTITYINYVANNETIINNFSENLYKSNHKITQNSDAYMFTAENNRGQTEYGGISKSGLRIAPFTNYLYFYSSVERYAWNDNEYAMNIKPKYTNGSGTYDLGCAVGNWEFPSYSWDSTYATLTFRNNYENKIRWECTVEAWAERDTIEVTYNFTTLESANITDFYINHAKIALTGTAFTSLSASIVKMNMSNYWLSWMYDYGIALKNTTNYVTRSISATALDYYVLDGSSDTEYSSGQSWILTLRIHKFINTQDEGVYFTASDFLDTGEELANFNYQVWVPLNFPDVTSSDADFYLKHFGGQYYHLVASTFDGTELKINLIGQTDQTVTHELYIADDGPSHLGAPEDVEGADTWLYDAHTKTLSFTVTYKSAQTITISWGRTSGAQNFLLTVWFTVNAWPASGTITLEGKNYTVAWMRQFELPYGTYRLTAYYGDQLQTKTVGVFANSSLGFNFEMPKSFQGPPFSLIFGVPIAIFVVIALFLFLKGRKK